jgi:hypothetical protein
LSDGATLDFVREACFEGQKPIGRRQASTEVRDLIFQMMAENPGLGAPRIHGELLMFGFEVSERTISRWMKSARRDPGSAKRWRYCFSSSATIAAAFCTATSRN